MSASLDADTVLFEEAIGALRISGRIIQKLADHPGCYRVDNGPPIFPGQVVALAWDTGLMGGNEGLQ